MAGARVRRRHVAYARSCGLSDRRACAVLSVARTCRGWHGLTGLISCCIIAAIPLRAGLKLSLPWEGLRSVRSSLRREPPLGVWILRQKPTGWA